MGQRPAYGYRRHRHGGEAFFDGLSLPLSNILGSGGVQASVGSAKALSSAWLSESVGDRDVRGAGAIPC